MSTLLEHLQKAWDLSKYKTSCGSLLAVEKIRHGEFQIYDGLYTQLESPAEVEGFYRKPPGTYLRGISIGSWEKLPGLYSRMLEFPLQKNMPMEERETLNGMLLSLKRTGVPDTVAYLTEEELLAAARDLEAVGYDPDTLNVALTVPPSPIEYHHFLCK